ncbi:hypothetical protein Ciccas_003617 [Cichlidogyrus casuarinus]|uniref:Uncharacterized protein n=1 Tax=Cichlidogyrus casuarinus TaxID=1844966 RepID=A0ABD2QDV3_9PLAT
MQLVLCTLDQLPITLQKYCRFRLYDEAKAVPALFLHEVQKMQAQKRSEAKILHRRSMVDQVPSTAQQDSSSLWNGSVKMPQMRRSLTLDAVDANVNTFPEMLLASSEANGPGSARPVSVCQLNNGGGFLSTQKHSDELSNGESKCGPLSSIRCKSVKFR